MYNFSFLVDDGNNQSKVTFCFNFDMCGWRKLKNQLLNRLCRDVGGNFVKKLVYIDRNFEEIRKNCKSNLNNPFLPKTSDHQQN